MRLIILKVSDKIESKEPRTKINVNREWRFIRGDWEGFSDNGPEQAEYDDSEWSDIGLPHSFSIPYFMENEWYIGYGWYRKHMDVDWNWITRSFTWNLRAYSR